MGTRFALALLTTFLVGSSSAQEAEPRHQEGSAPQYAGPIEDGFRLPNGWTITPVGNQVILNDLVLGIQSVAGGSHALATSNGYNTHQISLIDLNDGSIVAQETVRQSWFGLAVDEPAGKIWWSGGGNGLVHAFELDPDRKTLTKANPIEPGKDRLTVEERRDSGRFRSGITLGPDGKALYSLDIDNGSIDVIDLSGNAPEQTAEVGIRPYDLAFSKSGTRLYVSDWADRTVHELDPESLRVIRSISVGEHPNQIAVHPTDDRIFVACASSNCVSVIDTARGYVTETIHTSLFPRSPEGSTTDAVAVSPDGKTLFAANADNNCVAVIDISKPSESRVKGFIPTGWYPTAVAVSTDGSKLLVGVGKGNQTEANPFYEEGESPEGEGGRRRPYPYIGTTLSGALSIIPMPDDEKLQEYTEQVYENCPYSDELLTTAPYDRPTAIPTNVGDPSPIKHVLYIIKENRTYDQVFGDIPEGNGDPSLVMFGEEVTPNHHKLAREFVLLDNLYCNGQVSRDGHPWSTMAYNTDYISRDWLLTYSGREGVDDDEESDLATAPSGYIWDLCARNGLTYRSYREYTTQVTEPDGTRRMEGRVPGLVGHVHPTFGLRDGSGRPRDFKNAEIFIEEFREFEKNDNLPQFMVMSLGEDHTDGTRPGAFTPQACVASNDLGLGRIVEVISHSKYWPETAIFVIQDDAQNGPDHVDAHRTVGLVISPYTKRKALVSTQYTTSSMLRTIELILGLPPMSQYDAAANPMFDCFNAEADLTPYDHEEARIDLFATNSPLAYGADRSLKMDFSDYDRINDFELNEILWRAIKGSDAPLPPAVRRAIAFRPSMAKGVEPDDSE